MNEIHSSREMFARLEERMEVTIAAAEKRIQQLEDENCKLGARMMAHHALLGFTEAVVVGRRQARQERSVSAPIPEYK